MVFIANALVRTRGDIARGRPPSSPSPFASSHSTAPTPSVPDAAELHTLYLDEVYRYVARRMARREDAEDITAEVFAAAFEALPRFRGDVAPRLWLLGIARRKIADSLRRSGRRLETSWDTLAGDDTLPVTPPHTTTAHLPDPAHALARSEAKRAMRDVLAGLKEEQREALLLKYVEELSVEEVAVVMGRSKAAVNSLLQRARATAFRQGQAYFLPFLSDSSTTPESEVNR